MAVFSVRFGELASADTPLALSQLASVYCYYGFCSGIQGLFLSFKGNPRAFADELKPHMWARLVQPVVDQLNIQARVDSRAEVPGMRL